MYATTGNEDCFPQRWAGGKSTKWWLTFSLSSVLELESKAGLHFIAHQITSSLIFPRIHNVFGLLSRML